MRTQISLSLLLVFSAALPLVAASQMGMDQSQETIHTPDRIQWKGGPPSLPPGAQLAVLEGDPELDSEPDSSGNPDHS